VVKPVLMLAAVGLASLCCPAGTLAQASTPAAAVTIDAFAWLEGSWIRQTSRGISTEQWTRVSENTMEGLAFAMVGGARRVSEYLRLVRLGDDVFYVAKPGENPLPVAFKLADASATRFVFENAGHDFPQKITYTRLPADSLIVVIEGPMNGTAREIPFRFVRARE
jgi:hypothetical protein